MISIISINFTRFGKFKSFC